MAAELLKDSDRIVGTYLLLSFLKIQTYMSPHCKNPDPHPKPYPLAPKFLA